MTFKNSASSVTWDHALALLSGARYRGASYSGSSAISFGTAGGTNATLTQTKVYTGQASSNSYTALVLVIGY